MIHSEKCVKSGKLIGKITANHRKLIGKITTII